MSSTRLHTCSRSCPSHASGGDHVRLTEPAVRKDRRRDYKVGLIRSVGEEIPGAEGRGGGSARLMGLARKGGRREEGDEEDFEPAASRGRKRRLGTSR